MQLASNSSNKNLNALSSGSVHTVGLVHRQEHFEENCCLHLQDRRSVKETSLITMAAPYLSETSVQRRRE